MHKKTSKFRTHSATQLSSFEQMFFAIVEHRDPLHTYDSIMGAQIRIHPSSFHSPSRIGFEPNCKTVPKSWAGTLMHAGPSEREHARMSAGKGPIEKFLSNLLSCFQKT
jgi:hypothetical protein